jgi:hypothetical protein
LTYWQEMLDEGAVIQTHRILLDLGGIRFGEASESIRQRIEAITDLKELNRLTR